MMLTGLSMEMVLACVLAILTVRLSGFDGFDSVPKRPGIAFANAIGSKQSRIIGAALSAPALYLGKKVMDGPIYMGEPGSMSERIVVITGANTGLGKESAITLASLGAQVVILCRTAARCDAAVEAIKMASKSNLISSEICDLADLRSVDICAEKLKNKFERIDVLMNNAGVMAIPERMVTAQGFERHLGINHLGHFALTRHLMPLIERSEVGGRVVTVSSAAHLLGRLNRDDLLLDAHYEPWPAYGNSKLANILFTKALAAKLKAKKDSKVAALTLHPGVCRTELGRYIFDPKEVSIPPYLESVLGIAGAPAIYFTKSAKQGAQTQIFLAASPTISFADSGKYYDNSRVTGVSPEADNLEEALWLWDESEKLIGRKFQV